MSVGYRGDAGSTPSRSSSYVDPPGTGSNSGTPVTSNISISNGVADAPAIKSAFENYASSVGYVDGYGTQFAQAQNQLLVWSGFCATAGHKLCGQNLTLALGAVYSSFIGKTGSRLGRLVIGNDPNPVADGRLGIARDLTDVPVVQEVGGGSGPKVLHHYTTFDSADKISKGGTIKVGASGKIWLTPDVYTSGVEARANLALNKTPDGYFPVPVERLANLSGPTPVEPAGGEPGGGTEYVTTSENPGRWHRVHSFRFERRVMAADKRRFLVCYDYGSGGLWASILARSEQEIIDLYPELDVFVECPEWLTPEQAESYASEEELDIDGAAPVGMLNVVLETRAKDEHRSGNDRPVFLTGIGDPKTGAGTWLFLRARTQLEIRDKYPELTVVHGRPEWRSAVMADGRLANIAHDIDAPPSSLLADIVARRRNGAAGDQEQRSDG